MDEIIYKSDDEEIDDNDTKLDNKNSDGNTDIKDSKNNIFDTVIAELNDVSWSKENRK